MTNSGVLVGSHDYVLSQPIPNRTQEAIFNLAHDLRQPLSAIEAIAYYLEMTLPPGQSQARHYIHRLQQLVERSNEILNQAASDYKKQDVPARNFGVPS